MRRVWVLTPLVLLVAGCGDDPSYDASRVESVLVRTQAAAYDGIEVTGASCPDHELADVVQVRCTVTMAGTEVPFDVRLTHARATTVAVRARARGVLLSREKLGAEVAGSMGTSGKGAQVTCGKGDLVVAEVGQRLACEVVVGSQRSPVSVRVKDADGRVSVLPSS